MRPPSPNPHFVLKFQEPEVSLELERGSSQAGLEGGCFSFLIWFLAFWGLREHNHCSDSFFFIPSYPCDVVVRRKCLVYLKHA